MHHTRVACRFLDIERCRCTAYAERMRCEPDCMVVTPEIAGTLPWIPSTCAYRLVAEGKDLPEWHPLVSGDTGSVHRARISVRGFAVSESDVDEERIEEEIIEWVG